MKSILKVLVSVAALLGMTAMSAIAAPVEKEWTLLVFLNGDNNLDKYGTTDMNEMAKVGSTDKVNIVVLRDTSKTSTSTKIYYIEKGNQKVVKDYGSNIDMGDYKTLVEFFKYAKANYPAKRYLVDIWNHGAGWERRDVEDIVTRGISYDDHSGNHISTAQLGQAFRQMRDINDGNKIDVLGMDACLMEMAEVIYEVKDGANVVLGSEQTEPGDGWAYDGFLPYLANKPGMDAEELSTVIEREYANSYSGGTQGTQSVQGSAVSAERLTQAIGSFNLFTDRLTVLADLHNAGINRAIAGTQDYYYSQYKDAIHFIEQIKTQVPDQELHQLADVAIADFRNAVVANFVTGTGLEGSNGFSIWIPGATLFKSKKAEYLSLGWGKDTSWGNFLQTLLIPTKPVLSFTGVTIADEDSDGFVTAGDKIGLSVTINNATDVEATGVVARLVTPEGITPINAAIQVPALGKGATTVDGLVAMIDPTTEPGNYPAKIILDIPGMGSLEFSVMIGVDKDYTVESYALESQHNYPNSLDKTWTITKAGASMMRVHFARIATEARYDFIYVMDKDNNVLAKLDGKKQNYWSPIVTGDTVKIRFTSDSAVGDYGFAIDKIAY